MHVRATAESLFPSLATRETYVAGTNLASRKQNMFLPQVKNIFASWTQILLSKHVAQFGHHGSNVH